VSRDPRIGTRIGQYQVDREIGRGGMGVVYLAEHVHLQRPVALKVLSDHLANDAAYRERFLRESRMAARLRHPNIIPVYDAGEQDGVLFIAMQYVEGSDLSTVLESGPLSPEATLGILGSVASALDLAHGAGIVHRDVKPANIMLGEGVRPDGGHEVYLTDFGLVREIDRSSRLTQTGMFVGTLDYAAPEMFQNAVIDGRADQYSLGCVLYECLTGGVPFPRDSQGALIGAHLTDPPPPPSGARPGLPEGLDVVVTRAMAKAPADRFASCGDLIEAARAAATGAAAPAASRSGPTPTVAVPPPTVPPTHAVPPTPTVVARAPVPPGRAPQPPASGSPTPSPGGPPSGPPGVATPPGGAAPAPTGGSGRPWWIAAAVVGVIVVVVASILLAGRAGGPKASPTRGGTSAPPTSPPASTSPTTGPSTSPPSTAPTTGATGSPVAPGPHPVVDATVKVGTAPFGVARDESSVWVSNQGSGTISRIDPESHKVVSTRRGVPNAFEIASGLGSLWVTDQKQTLFRLDPAGGAPTRIHVEGGAFGVTVGFGSVWVTNDRADTVTRLDVNGKVLATIPTGHLPHGLTASDGAIWIAGDTGSVTRVDPATNTRVATIQVPTGSAFQVAGEAGSIWVTNGITDLIQIDPGSNKVVKTIRTQGGSFDVVGGFGSVWVTNANFNTLSRVDVAKQKVVDVLDVGVSPRLIAVGPEGLWVVNGDSASVSLVHP
jgi:serine/threonine-protein kinase